MVGILLSVLGTAVSLLLVDIVFPGVYLANFPAAMIAGGVIGVINALVKPVLTLLSIPFTVLTLGGFLLIVNGFCFWLASILVPGFAVHGLIAFLLAPVVLSIVNTSLTKYFAEKYPSKTPELTGE